MKRKADRDETLLRFRVGDRWCGIPIAAVRQVVSLRGLHRVPRAPACLPGVAEVQGRLYTVLDPVPFLTGETGAPVPRYGVLLNPPYAHLALAAAAAPEVVSAKRETASGAGGWRIGTDGRIGPLPVEDLVAACEEKLARRVRPDPGTPASGEGG